MDKDKEKKYGRGQHPNSRKGGFKLGHKTNVGRKENYLMLCSSCHKKYDITPSAKYKKMFRAIMLDIWQSNYKKLDEVNVRTQKDIERLQRREEK